MQYFITSLRFIAPFDFSQTILAAASNSYRIMTNIRNWVRTSEYCAHTASQFEYTFNW